MLFSELDPIEGQREGPCGHCGRTFLTFADWGWHGDKYECAQAEIRQLRTELANALWAIATYVERDAVVLPSPAAASIVQRARELENLRG